MNRIVALVMIALLAGCSSVMATKQPPKKDLSVLEPGTERYRLIAELGKPVYSEERDGVTYDVFAFTQGYSGGAKAGRAIAHGAASVYTLGLWELFGTAIEGAADGKDVQVLVSYDADQRVDEVELLNGRERDRDDADEAG